MYVDPYTGKTTSLYGDVPLASESYYNCFPWMELWLIGIIDSNNHSVMLKVMRFVATELDYSRIPDWIRGLIHLITGNKAGMQRVHLIKWHFLEYYQCRR